MSMTQSSFGSGLIGDLRAKKHTRNDDFNSNLNTDFLNNIVSQDAIPISQKRKINSLVKERKSASQTTDVMKSKQYLRLLIKL